MLRRTGGACSTSGGKAIRIGITHRLWCEEARMNLDPGKGQVMTPADGGEKASDALNERIVASRIDEVVPEGSYPILAVW